NGGARPAPAPLPSRQVRPASAFGVAAVTGCARFLKQLLAGRDILAGWMLREEQGSRKDQQTDGASEAHAKTILYPEEEVRSAELGCNPRLLGRRARGTRCVTWRQDEVGPPGKPAYSGLVRGSQAR